jgi:hypothetical protein
MASVAGMACFYVNDGDLGFHLATGRDILLHGRIPARNVLSFAEPNHPWLLHQWLPALLFEWLWQHGGLAQLMGLKLALVMATWWFVFASGCALGAPPSAAAASCALAAAASAFRFELRPYLFTHLTLAIGYWALCRGGRARLWVAAAALAIGCQLHAGALDTALVMLLFGAGVAAQRQVRSALALWLAAISGLALGALALALYHPWGARVLEFPFEMARHRYWHEHLVEFRHTYQLPFAPLAAYWLWLALVALVLIARRGQPRPGVWCCSAAYALISLIYARQAFAFAIVSAPLMATAIATQTARVRSPLTAAALVVLCAIGPLYVYRDHAPGVGLSPLVWPRAQFAFIRSHALRGHAFVSDAWGGPFLGEFYPQRRVFFDNRLEAYSDGFARDVYQRIRYGEPGWDRLLDRYEIELCLLRYTTPGEARFQHGAPNVRQLLVRDPRWRLVFFDDFGELFVRAQGANAQLASSAGIAGVDPDRHTFVGKPSDSAAALLRAAERGATSLTLLGMTALALADARHIADARALIAVMRARAPEDEFTMYVTQRVGP